MKQIQYLIIILLSTFLGCRQKEQPESVSLSKITDSPNNQSSNHSDTSKQYIYDFMKIVIAEQKLDLNHGLTLEPEQRCDLAQDDKTFLNTLLIEAKPKKDEDEANSTRDLSLELNTLNLRQCLLKADVNDMLLQKEKLSVFKWDNSRFGFDLLNERNWYCFSVPLFSKDKQKAVMMIRDLCSGLCGQGSTILFTKEDNKWTSQILGAWWH